VIYIGADHRGYNLKGKIKEWLSEWGRDYEDVGALTFDPADDFPDFAAAVGKAVALSLSKEQKNRGILICGSGIGIAIAANKIKGVRAGTAANPKQAEAAVHDEDMNVLSLSADFLNEKEAKDIVQAFIEAKFGNEERYNRRLNKIEALENHER